MAENLLSLIIRQQSSVVVVVVFDQLEYIKKICSLKKLKKKPAFLLKSFNKAITSLLPKLINRF
jgi:hypothetical protein